MQAYIVVYKLFGWGAGEWCVIGTTFKSLSRANAYATDLRAKGHYGTNCDTRVITIELPKD